MKRLPRGNDDRSRPARTAPHTRTPARGPARGGGPRRRAARHGRRPTAVLDAALQRGVTDPGSPAEITVDVSGLGFCDSAGLNVLLRAQLTALSHGRTLRLHGPNPQLLKLLKRTGALALFDLGPPPAPEPTGGHTP
ncbi:STAS domain-containing protein [Streptomyces sp. NPDC058622]|uniref:STAS domain-containing protein n=1 Tax=Streptomyces sp. NPDC058622 TaxID=3346562 RepID=UPI00364E3DD6